MKTSEELFREWTTIHNSAQDSIVAILKAHNNHANFPNTDDMEVHIDCYGKWECRKRTVEVGRVIRVETNERGDIVITAQGLTSTSTYRNEYVSHDVGTYIGILINLEYMEAYEKF